MLLLILMNGQVCPVYNGCFNIFHGSSTGNTYHNINSLEYGGLGGDYWNFASQDSDGFIYVGF